jgi:dynein heavy chain, axonemal
LPQTQLSEDFFRRSGRRNYVTPTSYLELMTMFTLLLGQKRDEVSKAKKRYEGGLEKLLFTAEQVSLMQKELTELKPVLVQTGAETEELMAVVKREKSEVRERE